MKRRRLASAAALLFIALTFVLVSARPFAAQQNQPARPAAQNAAPEAQQKIDEPAAPPEVAALNDALKITDVPRRYSALQKVIDDYPKSEAANIARSQISRQLFSGLSASRSAVDYMSKTLANSTDPSVCNQFAASLLRVDLFLEQAEAVAKHGLAIDEATYVAATREARKSAGAPLVPVAKDGTITYTLGSGTGGRGGRGGRTPREVSDAELREQFKTAHTDLLATLGQVFAKRGNTAEAMATLKQAYGSDLPSAARRSVATALADLAAKSGDAQAEVEYRASAYVLGGASPAARQSLEAAYRTTHGGSVDGLEALLDETYRKAAKPLEVKPYARPAAKAPRVVLAELFTGAACPPCVGADMAFDALLERFSRQDVAVIVYHQHIPGPDPMTNPATEARKPIYSLRGVPTFAIDGKSTVGGGGADAAETIFKDDLQPAVEKQLAAAPEARIALKASVAGSVVKVQANVSDVKSTSKQLKLQIALVEDLQRYSGPNGVRFHPMVVRSLAGVDFKGFPVTAKGTKVEHTFDIAKIVADNRKWTDEFLSKPFRGGDKPTFVDGRREEIDVNKLMVVAFVQDEDPAQDKPTKPADKAPAAASQPATGTPAGAGQRGANAPAGAAQPAANAPTAAQAIGGGSQPAAAARPEPASPVRHVLQAAMVKVPAVVKKTTN